MLEHWLRLVVERIGRDPAAIVRSYDDSSDHPEDVGRFATDHTIIDYVRNMKDMCIINMVMCGACREGRVRMVGLMIFQHHAHWWDLGLEAACRGGHEKIAALMIELGATDLAAGLRAARANGQARIIKYMASRMPPAASA